MIKSMLPQCGSTFCLGHSCSGAARGNWATGLTCRLSPLPLLLSLSLSLSHSRARLDVCRHEASAACQRVWMLQMSYSLPLSLYPPSLLPLSLFRPSRSAVSGFVPFRSAARAHLLPVAGLIFDYVISPSSKTGHLEVALFERSWCHTLTLARCQRATVFRERQRERGRGIERAQ